MWALAHTLFFVFTPRYKERLSVNRECVSCNRNLDKSTSFLLTAESILIIYNSMSREFIKKVM